MGIEKTERQIVQKMAKGLTADYEGQAAIISINENVLRDGAEGLVRRRYARITGKSIDAGYVHDAESADGNRSTSGDERSRGGRGRNVAGVEVEVEAEGDAMVRAVAVALLAAVATQLVTARTAPVTSTPRLGGRSRNATNVTFARGQDMRQPSVRHTRRRQPGQLFEASTQNGEIRKT